MGLLSGGDFSLGHAPYLLTVADSHLSDSRRLPDSGRRCKYWVFVGIKVSLGGAYTFHGVI